MNIGEISFCNSVGYNIRSLEDKSRILQEIKDFYGIPVLARHFERYHTETSQRVIRTKPHLLCTRSKGTPQLLYLTKISGLSQCVFIDRKIYRGHMQPRLVLTKLWFHRDLFSGTLFEGELVQCSNGKWLFLISDLLVNRGTALINCNLVKRINTLYSILDSMFMPNDMDPCAIQVKRYFTYEQSYELQKKFIPSLPYHTTGIIFKSLFMKFNDILFVLPRCPEPLPKSNTIQEEKLKICRPQKQMLPQQESKHENEIIQEDENCENGDNDNDNNNDNDKTNDLISTAYFLIKRTNLPDVYELTQLLKSTFAQMPPEPQQPEHEGRIFACIPDIQTSKMMREAFKESELKAERTVRCEMHSRFNKWVPVEVC